ncbi:MAG: hypothetical protein KF724_01125 [Phycisphaeraceae bacterium]|nr:hypothetical protein [Phycisphaeraceae bacterium]
MSPRVPVGPTARPRWMTAWTVAAAVLLAPGTHAGDPIKVDMALDLVPPDALGVIVLADPRASSDDIAQCIARMDRPEALLLGRPIDTLKAQLGIGAGLDDAAPVVAWWQPLGGAGDLDAPVVVLGTLDPTQFLEANFTEARDIAPDAWRREETVVYAKSVDRLVLLSPDADTVRKWTHTPGFATLLQNRLGESAMRLARSGDLFAWAGPRALTQMRTRLMEQAMLQAGDRSAEVERLARIAEGMSDALVVVDIDPLGLSIRTLSIFEPESAIGALTRGGVAGGKGVDRLPGQPGDTLFAMAVDLRGLGGGGPLLEVARLIGIDPFIPTWAVEHKDLVDRVQVGFYRSRLGYSAGIFNDSAVFIETKDPERVRGLIRQWIESMTGPDPITGVSRTPSWEEARALRSGETVTAFEVAEDEKAAQDAEGATVTTRMAQQLIVGPRGFRGFVRVVPGGVVMTLSHRTDVLGRATDAAAGKGTLAESGTVRALRRWLLPEADIEGFIGIGPIVRMAYSAAAAFGVAPANIEIPERLEPVAFALSVHEGRVETAAMVPTGVLALMWDQAMAINMPGGAGARRGAGQAAPRQQENGGTEP